MHSWAAQVEQLTGYRGLKVTLQHDGAQVAYSSVLEAWQHQADCRSMFLKLLQNAPYSAFRWETPPITKATASRPFEFVLLDSPGLATNPDPVRLRNTLRRHKPMLLSSRISAETQCSSYHVKRGSDPLTDIAPPLCGMLPKDNNTLFGKWWPVR